MRVTELSYVHGGKLLLAFSTLPEEQRSGVPKVATGQVKTGETSSMGLDTVRKINWPDLVFEQVNLWSLPSASFFYRNLVEK